MSNLDSKFESIELDSSTLKQHDDSLDSEESTHRPDFEDPVEPRDEFTLAASDPPEHWLNRLRVVLSGPHQSLVARLLLVSLILMSLFFARRWYLEHGLVDIDRVDSIHADFKVDINSAEIGEMVVLPGVGIKLAQAIVDHRQESGGFASLNELCDVPGIGKKTLESLKPYLVPIQSPGAAK